MHAAYTLEAKTPLLIDILAREYVLVDMLHVVFEVRTGTFYARVFAAQLLLRHQAEGMRPLVQLSASTHTEERSCCETTA